MRAPWDVYFSSIAEMVKSRATCPRLQVGSVLVRDKHIISTGYNGVPKGLPHCDESGCVMVDGHCSLSIHSEVNALDQCGVDTRYSILYVTANPCAKCALYAYEKGVRRIVYASTYRSVDYAALGLNPNQLPDIVKLHADSNDIVKDNH